MHSRCSALPLRSDRRVVTACATCTWCITRHAATRQHLLPSAGPGPVVRHSDSARARARWRGTNWRPVRVRTRIVHAAHPPHGLPQASWDRTRTWPHPPGLTRPACASSANVGGSGRAAANHHAAHVCWRPLARDLGCGPRGKAKASSLTDAAGWAHTPLHHRQRARPCLVGDKHGHVELLRDLRAARGRGGDITPLRRSRRRATLQCTGRGRQAGTQGSSKAAHARMAATPPRQAQHAPRAGAAHKLAEGARRPLGARRRCPTAVDRPLPYLPRTTCALNARRTFFSRASITPSFCCRSASSPRPMKSVRKLLVSESTICGGVAHHARLARVFNDRNRGACVWPRRAPAPLSP